ncbi:unnamed protein product [Orchesella dallaii]|uniref:C-type lectin domain-containing protein n=1 Tax=Orchesella dallaii TaxID=48710 RepID=A0ABP1RZ58_9HEXA
MNTNRNHFPIVFIILQFLFFCSSSEVDRQYVSGGSHNVKGSKPRLVTLGIIDGKAYLIDENIRTWKETDGYCKRFGMEMGAITSPGQLAFLKSAYNETTFHAGYWLGARDALLPRQFSWEGSKDEVTSLNDLTWHIYVDEPLTCLVYASQTTPSITLRPCEYMGMRALCEVK